MSRNMRYLWRSLAIGAPAAGGYCAGSYASGTLGYAPVRSKAWVDRELDTAPGVAKLKSDPHFSQIASTFHVSRLHGEDGAVSESMLSFRDLNDPKHTCTFVHCGPRTVGFPFIVHGGVLGTLLRQAAALALAKDHASGSLAVKYRRPTIVDQVLRIETKQHGKGLDMFIYGRNDKLLVQAFYE